MDHQPHPSECRSFAYSHPQRQAAIAVVNEGMHHDPAIQHLRDQGLWSSMRSSQRWSQQLIETGTLRSKKKTGNNHATVLRGHDLLYLAMYRASYPKATAADIIAFLHNTTGRFYHPSQISRAEDRLGLSRKKGSTTARQALLPLNLLRRSIFWNLNYPFGVADIAMNDMIDIDEAGIFLETADRSWGKAVTGMRVRAPGPYGHSEKWTLLMAVSGRPGPLDRFVRLEQRPGTDIHFFYAFIFDMIQQIGPGAQGNRRCFTMDNLTAHKHPTVLNLIVASGHRFSFRAPYYPVDGPIEYVFHTVQYQLTINMHNIYTHQHLYNDIFAVINGIQNFVPYFQGVGFT
jgi:transposase